MPTISSAKKRVVSSPKKMGHRLVLILIFIYDQSIINDRLYHLLPFFFAFFVRSAKTIHPWSVIRKGSCKQATPLLDWERLIRLYCDKFQHDYQNYLTWMKKELWFLLYPIYNKKWEVSSSLPVAVAGDESNELIFKQMGNCLQL